tara:strand:- start:303 stop:1082 length:780 start_codon:yes stop_codon:yes gene_type:complete
VIVDYSRYLSEKEKETFYEKGFLHKKNLINQKICEEILNELNQVSEEKVLNSNTGNSTYLRNLKQKNEKNYFGLSYLMNSSIFCNSIKKIMHLKLLSLSSFLLDRDDCYFSDNELHIRQPEINHPIPSHQDNFYFRLKNPKALTCYIFLTKQNRESGGLGFLPSNISKNKVESHSPSNIVGFSSYVKEREAIKDKFEYPNTSPGDVIFHHCTTFHRADSNKSKYPSIAASIRVFSYGCLEKDKNLEKRYLKNLKFNKSI